MEREELVFVCRYLLLLFVVGSCLVVDDIVGSLGEGGIACRKNGWLAGWAEDNSENGRHSFRHCCSVDVFVGPDIDMKLLLPYHDFSLLVDSALLRLRSCNVRHSSQVSRGGPNI